MAEENIKIKIWEDNFSVVKSKNLYPNAFANIKDKNELTVIIKESEVKEEDIIEIEKDWKLITFNTVFDFGVVGFIAKISDALAKEKISIFVISSYSTDHILIKNKDLKKTIKILAKLGFNKLK